MPSIFSHASRLFGISSLVKGLFKFFAHFKNKINFIFEKIYIYRKITKIVLRIPAHSTQFLLFLTSNIIMVPLFMTNKPILYITIN